MRVTRRSVLLGAVTVPVLFTVGRGLATLSDAARAGAVGMRPPARGTSTTSCAACGARDHGMLDPRCPAAPRVL